MPPRWATRAKKLLLACGSPTAAEKTEALLAGGSAALGALLEQLHAGAPTGAKGANGRAVMEDLETCLVLFAQAEPEPFIDALARYPELAERFDVLSAVARCPSERAAELLTNALGSRSGSLRWLALSALVRRGVDVQPRLGDLLWDRDHLVVFETTKALLDLGEPEHLPRLTALVEDPRTSIGTREAALDAIEAIRLRDGQPVAEARLFEVELPPEAEPEVTEATLVRPGELLARSPNGNIVAPRRAVVVAVRARRLVLRKRDD